MGEIIKILAQVAVMAAQMVIAVLILMGKADIRTVAWFWLITGGVTLLLIIVAAVVGLGALNDVKKGK